MLSHWNEFCDLVKTGKTDCAAGPFNVFKARYECAIRFQSCQFEPGYSEPTELAYASGIKLLLSYSAAEALWRALGNRGDSINGEQWKLEDPSLSASLQTICSQLIEKSKAFGLKSKLVERLKDVSSSSGNNIFPILRALRHSFAHGHFTAWGQKDSPEGAAELIGLASEGLLADLDHRFSIYVEQIKSKS